MSDFSLKEKPRDQLPYLTGKEVDPEKLFGRLCADIRRSLGMSQEQLAAKVGLEPSQLWALEKGFRTQDTITREALVRLVTILLEARWSTHS